MTMIKPIKRIDRQKIACGGEFTLTLGLTVCPEPCTEAAQIVLLLDRSGSMVCGGKLEQMQAGAKKLIDLMTEATGGGKTIGGGTEVGLVSFACDVTVDQPLTDQAGMLKRKIDLLPAGGTSNPVAGIRAALKLFESRSGRQKILIIFTDGGVTEQDDPGALLREAKAAGVIVCCAGLGAPRALLESWVSAPADAHAAWNTAPEEIRDLVRSIIGRKTGGIHGAVIREMLQPDFEIVKLERPSAGKLCQMTDQSFEWSLCLPACGREQTALVRAVVRHIGKTGGMKKVNQSASYTDADGNELCFPEPVVEVEACAPQPQPCPDGAVIRMDGCQETVCAALEEAALPSLGRIVQLDVTIRAICPGKRVAVAVQLTETGPCGKEAPRGMKIFTIPAHHAPGCADAQIRCIRFVVPEDLNQAGNAPLCESRSFKARVFANYIDFDEICCKTQIILP